jgi:hypothetical protein
MNTEKIIERIESEILNSKLTTKRKSGVSSILEDKTIESGHGHEIVDFLGISRRFNRSAINQIIEDETKVSNGG